MKKLGLASVQLVLVAIAMVSPSIVMVPAHAVQASPTSFYVYDDLGGYYKATYPYGGNSQTTSCESASASGSPKFTMDTGQTLTIGIFSDAKCTHVLNTIEFPNMQPNGDQTQDSVEVSSSPI
jgi:hypothetical protein